MIINKKGRTYTHKGTFPGFKEKIGEKSIAENDEIFQNLVP